MVAMATTASDGTDLGWVESSPMPAGSRDSRGANTMS